MNNIKIALENTVSHLVYLQDNIHNLQKDIDVDNGRVSLSYKDGICASLHEMSINFDRKMFRTWSGYSGEPHYPVEGSVEYHNLDNLWLNPKRLQLVDFCIGYVREMQGVVRTIERLTFILDNLDGLSQGVDLTDEQTGETFLAVWGICSNALYELKVEVRQEVFKTWIYFSGDLKFPVQDAVEYRTSNSLYSNPKRVSLIKHCIRYLKDLAGISIR